MSQVHKRFTSDQVKELLDRYSKKKVERNYLQEILGIKKRRFFALLKQYRDDPEHFTIRYERRVPSRTLSPKIDKKYPQRVNHRKENH